MFFARYAAKLAICCPFALLCYLPLSGFLRLPLKKLAALSALGVTAFVGIGALACCRFQLSVNALLFPALLLFLLLYLKSVALPPSKALFVFFTATMLVSFSATLSCYLCAPLELHNDQPVFTLPSGLIGLALTFAVLLVFSLLFRRKIHWMLCNVSFSAIWRALFVAPLFLTGLFIWMTPIYPAVVLTGRVREISIVLLISFLSLLFWFYYFVYLTTRKMSEAAELHAQNQLLSMENTRYRELREHMDATRQLRHDFRQHLHVIAGLSEAKKYDKLNDYLAEYEGRLASPAHDALRQRRAGRDCRPLSAHRRDPEHADILAARSARAPAARRGRSVHDAGQSAGKRAARRLRPARRGAGGSGGFRHDRRRDARPVRGKRLCR